MSDDFQEIKEKKNKKKILIIEPALIVDSDVDGLGSVHCRFRGFKYLELHGAIRMYLFS